MTDLRAILEDMNVFKKYYDSARLVDPLIKEVLNSDGTSSSIIDSEQSAEQCHKFWATGHVCLNCISMRAALENDTFVKFEDVKGKIYMVTALPIRLGDQVVALELLKDVTNQNILESIMGNLGDEAEPLDIRMHIARLNELVVKDGLTQIYNRKFINEKLPVEIIKAKLEQSPLSLIMTDIDHFKRVNDQHGHIAGDDVLKAFAAELKKHVRVNNGDWVARYGGEEFLICMPNCDKQAAHGVAERMRKAIESMEFLTCAGTLRITASFGVHTFLGEDIDVPQLLNNIDKNLYRAKQSGRNRVIVG